MSIEDENEYNSNSDFELDNSKKLNHKRHLHNPNGFGNVLQKILSQKSDSILSKRVKDKDIKQLKNNIQNDSIDEALLENTNNQEKKLKNIIQKFDWEEMCHNKDTLFDREKEKRLQRIATRGVVTLFNSVRKQQNLIENKLKDIKSVRAKEKFLSSDISKSKFFDILKSNDNTKDDINEEKNWNVLRDDFMMEADLKDWDKMSIDQEMDLIK